MNQNSRSSAVKANLIKYLVLRDREKEKIVADKGPDFSAADILFELFHFESMQITADSFHLRSIHILSQCISVDRQSILRSTDGAGGGGFLNCYGSL